MSNELDSPSDLGDYMAARNDATAGEVDDSLAHDFGRIAAADR